MSGWSEAARARAESLVASYPDRRSAVMPLLYIAMHQEGRLTEDGIVAVAELTGLSTAQVHGVASFYTMYKREVGRHLLSVCTSISCHLLGAEEVLGAPADEATVVAGGTADDGSVTVEAVECIGACGGAPAAQVDYETVEGLTAETVRALCRWLIDETPAEVRSDDLQERFGGRRSFDWGPEDETAAIGPVPAFGPYGTTEAP
jgi:NADH-quinone oxidoreductase subunit E